MTGAFPGIYPGDLLHWSTLPMLACLAATLAALRRAWRHRLGAFDPLVWLEGFTVYLVGLAPMGHVLFRRFIAVPLAPEDYRPWMGAMALLNLAGLGLRWWLTTPVYRAREAAAGAEVPGPDDVDPRRARRLARSSRRWSFFAASSFVALLLAVGGPLGFLRESALRHEGFEGLGMLVMGADLLPMAGLLWWLAAGLGRSVSQRRLWWALLTACTAQFLVSGLRGSRIQLVFFGMVALGWLLWRGLRLRRGIVTAAVLAALAFSFVYGLYKEFGAATFLRVVTFREPVPSTENRRDVGTLLLGDLSRADVQANVLWSVITRPGYTNLAMGRTYASDVLVHVPSFARPDVEAWSKVKVGGSRFFGRLRAGFRPGYIYGLAGEALLNFGPLLVLPMMALHAWGVRLAMGWCDRRGLAGMPVRLLWPLVAILLITAWMSDLDQVIYVTLRFFALPFAVISAAWRTPLRAARKRRVRRGKGRRRKEG